MKLKMISNGTGNWEINRFMDQNNKAFIVRFPNMFFQTRINHYLKIHQLIKEIGLPTLLTGKEILADGRTGIMTEDLNYRQHRLYVTPNSLQTNADRKKEIELGKYFPGINKKVIRSPYEKQRHKKKLSRITNYEIFLAQIKSDLITATDNHIFLEYDSYFFGTDIAEHSSIDYKLVDFDNVEIMENHTALYAKNVDHFVEIFNRFTHSFIKKKYKDQYIINDSKRRQIFDV